MLTIVLLRLVGGRSVAPWLDLCWAFLAAFIVCRCLIARHTLTPSARIALLLIALLLCPIISAADDFAAISRPNDHWLALDAVALFVPVLALVMMLVAFGFVRIEEMSPASALLFATRESRGPPAVLAA